MAKSIQISLDNLISSAFFYTGTWTPDAQLKSNASFNTFRFLLIRLYEEGNGKPLDARIQLSIGNVADKLGLSRYWTGVLIHRLSDAGWLEIHSSWTGERMKSSTIFRAGRMLKRLVFHLLASRRKKAKKSPHSSDVNDTCQFLPLTKKIREKREEHRFQEQAEATLKQMTKQQNPFGLWANRLMSRL